MAFTELSYEVNDHIGVITLRRPEAMNSLTYTLYMELEDAVRESEARVLVITGEGRAFCAGDDVKQILGGTEGPPAESIERGRKTGGLTPAADALLYSDIPIIAAVNGYCLGGGMEFALSCHIRLADEKAQFGQPEINLGVIPGACGTQRLTKAVGKAIAMEMVLNNRHLTAEEALHYGLVNKVVPVEEFLDAAISLASQIANRAPLAVQAPSTAWAPTPSPAP